MSQSSINKVLRLPVGLVARRVGLAISTAGSLANRDGLRLAQAPAGMTATCALGRAEPFCTPLFVAVTAGSFWAVLRRDPHRDWRSGFATGPVSSTYSTVVLAFGAARIGRDAKVDFMELAPIWLGARVIESKPTRSLVFAGIVMHQIADLAWATLLFGLGSGRLRQLANEKLTALSVPWAVLTSFIEYYLILPWLQPLVPRQVPYWMALSVHLISGVSYSQYPWIRAVVTGSEPRDTTSARLAALVLAVGVGVLGILDWLGRSGHELAFYDISGSGV